MAMLSNVETWENEIVGITRKNQTTLNKYLITAINDLIVGMQDIKKPISFGPLSEIVPDANHQCIPRSI